MERGHASYYTRQNNGELGEGVGKGGEGRGALSSLEDSMQCHGAAV